MKIVSPSKTMHKLAAALYKMRCSKHVTKVAAYRPEITVLVFSCLLQMFCYFCLTASIVLHFVSTVCFYFWYKTCVYLTWQELVTFVFWLAFLSFLLEVC